MNLKTTEYLENKELSLIQSNTDTDELTIAGKEMSLSELINIYKNDFINLLKENNCNKSSITLKMNIINGDLEYITNFNVKNKIEYIKKAYDENLHLKNCNEIYIAGYYFSAIINDNEIPLETDSSTNINNISIKGLNPSGIDISKIDLPKGDINNLVAETLKMEG